MALGRRGLRLTRAAFRPRSREQVLAPYAEKVALLARAARLYHPGDKAIIRLNVKAQALVLMVKGGGQASVPETIARIRRDLTTYEPEDALARDLRDDIRAALNRLSGMIRSNDPNPKDPT